MNEIKPSRCPRCSGKQQFDAKQGFDNLSRRYDELAFLVSRYMSEANMERRDRNTNAFAMAAKIKRIVGGVPVSKGEYPECCLVGQMFPNGSASWFCTGVLVHPRVVLTAAHCHNPSEGLSVNVVALNAENEDYLSGAEIVPVRFTKVHPDYPASGLNDIAVLILRQNATTPPVNPATTSEINASEMVTLAGFGNDDINSTRGFGIKRVVEVPLIAVRRSPAEGLDELEHLYGFESDLEFVAGGDGYDSCNGDSGGPAYILVDGERKAAGLTSRSTRTATAPCGDGGIYTRVDTQKNFINSIMDSANLKSVISIN